MKKQRIEKEWIPTHTHTANNGNQGEHEAYIDDTPVRPLISISSVLRMNSSLDIIGRVAVVLLSFALLPLISAQQQPTPMTLAEATVSASSSSIARLGNMDFWSAPVLQAHLSAYQGFDAALLFYAPWCSHCNALAPLWSRVSELLSSGTSASGHVSVLFDCESSDAAAQLCTDVGVKHYPTVMYLGAGPYYASDFVTRALFGEKAGGPAGLAKHERMVTFQGNLNHGEEIRDFIILMRSLSTWHKYRQNNFLSNWIWGKRKPSGSDPIGLTDPSENSAGSPSSSSSLSSDSAALAQAVLLMDSLLTATPANLGSSQGDIFSLVSQNKLWSDASLASNLITKSCYVDLVFDYCSRVVSRLSRELPLENSDEAAAADRLVAALEGREPYCKLVDGCLQDDFRPAKCRPGTCPFQSKVACNYIDTCLDESVREEYEKVLFEEGYSDK